MTEAAPTLLHLRLEGFEGPLDLLLDLARAQKVDLGEDLHPGPGGPVLAVLDQARRVRLELAADWLVMAAWLAWLKSRLLVPEDPEQQEDAEALAAALTDRLAELARMRAAAAWLGARQQLGREVFAAARPSRCGSRTAPASPPSCPPCCRPMPARAAGRWRAGPMCRSTGKLWTVQEALARLGRLVGALPDWAMLQRFLPDGLTDPVEQRARPGQHADRRARDRPRRRHRAAPGAEPSAPS